MRRGLLSDYFIGIAVKRLSVVETTSAISNQHEFNGSRPLRAVFGNEDRLQIPTRFIWLGDEQEGISDDGVLSWYDSRRNQPHRSAEFRLYYYQNAVSDLMRAGDTLFVATRRDGTAMIIISASGSTIQSQLLWLFGLPEEPELEFSGRSLEGEEAELDFAARYIFDELGIEPGEPDADYLDSLLEQFGARFPSTRAFSAFARQTLTHVSPMDDPDAVLMAWVEREELLFRRLERHVVTERLKNGFTTDGAAADVDGFLSFSLSVQNRRKSRAGQSLENHLEELLSTRAIRFVRGAGTENGNKPDFLFPGVDQYRDRSFPSERLTMLGAKSTCKDRWRQVLSEAERIRPKHLLTLEPGISENQTNEMQAKGLRLILPQSLHQTYRELQREWLINLGEFLSMVRERELN